LERASIGTTFEEEVIIIRGLACWEGNILEGGVGLCAQEVDAIITSSVEVTENMFDAVVVFLMRAGG
jgi:hypothetical protein